MGAPFITDSKVSSIQWSIDISPLIFPAKSSTRANQESFCKTCEDQAKRAVIFSCNIQIKDILQFPGEYTIYILWVNMNMILEQITSILLLNLCNGNLFWHHFVLGKWPDKMSRKTDYKRVKPLIFSRKGLFFKATGYILAVPNRVINMNLTQCHEYHLSIIFPSSKSYWPLNEVRFGGGRQARAR